MSVYVDHACYVYGRMIMCHMIADTPIELHAMADEIDVARRWFQTPPKASFWHYDSLLTYGRIETTEAKAKELRSFADSTITLGISVHTLVAKGDQATKEERAKIVHARRMAR